ncbi:MAG: hypothetical protein ACM32F_07845 [Betaproteobacteria bacterium]
MRPTGARVVAWHDHDDPAIRDARIVGRALVTLEGGGVLHALILDDGRTFRAVYWDRERNAFTTCGIDNANDGHGARRA